MQGLENLQGFLLALLCELQCSACRCREREGRQLAVIQEAGFASQAQQKIQGQGSLRIGQGC